MVMYNTNWSHADYVSGHPALDFLNTVADTGKSRRLDRIPDWPSVYGWAIGAGLLSPQAAESRSQSSAQDTGDTLKDLHALRADAYAFMFAVVQGNPPADDGWLRLQDILQTAIARSELVADKNTFAWQPDRGRACYLIDTIALALEQLIRSPDLQRVHQCGRYTWLFINRGRGIGRRWCDMRTCGNRAKAEAFRRQ